MWHVTARMAWHDNSWNGTVCEDPVANTYCTGSHSLLSERLGREKRLHLERDAAGEKLDATLPDYLPPCFWSSCAYAEAETKVLHRHPFSKFKNEKKIDLVLPANSIYTWPFRLSLTHASNHQHGQYFPDLEDRIDRYCQRLVKDRSLIFFYLNYDNPISADDYLYALVGCARLSDVKLTGHFDFEESELQEVRNGERMQNFPTLNWAIQLTHEGGIAAVRLPYQEYLAHIAEHPEDEEKLEEIRVLIEEPALLPGFKYVSEQINDDHALALLYKLKRAFSVIAQHGICDVGHALDTLDQYIRETWESRDLYPGLGAVVSILADLAEGEPQKENPAGQRFVDALHQLDFNADLLDYTFDLLEGRKTLPDSLTEYSGIIRDACTGLKDRTELMPVLRKLSLFSLTSWQVARIIFPNIDDFPAFGGLTIDEGEIEKNPYLLSESYVPGIDSSKNDADLDREQRIDGPIDYFTIDIGMFPDKHYIDRNDALQNLTVAGAERLRAFSVEALKRNEKLGHSFALLATLVEEAEKHPLFYRDKIVLSESQFLSKDRLAHFQERLYVRDVDGEYYFYLQETKDAEDIVARFVRERMALEKLKVNLNWLDQYLEDQVAELKKDINEFDAATFKTERRHLMEGALQHRFYCVTGRPGSGKTQALQALLDYLGNAGETATVLAPTGKAALRLRTQALPDTKWTTETIARWVYRSGLGEYLHGSGVLTKMSRTDRYRPTDNIVIDEMSMVDLPQLALLFRALEVHQSGALKRVILVGDENQLPPIGCGRPFHDIIAYLREDISREQHNLARLTVNCRQQHDETVLHAAHLFAGKNRYHTDLYERLLKGGKISRCLNVQYWESAEQLQKQVEEFIGALLPKITDDQSEFSINQRFNNLLGLYNNGFVPKADAKELALDRAQLLTPYRAGLSGSLGLSAFVRNAYRGEEWSERVYQDTNFAHSDKIIRLSNYYAWNPQRNRKELYLSNGSIGVVCDHRGGRRAYFPESAKPLYWKRFDEEDFELAYAITVHKAQGSEFQEVLMVIPERRALLSRELIYTALTRSKTKLTVLIQKNQDQDINPIQIARERSVLLLRNSSIFATPFNSRQILEPEYGIKVKSKIEYLIYRELQDARDAGRLTFAYEEPLELPINGHAVKVKPDFTIWCDGKTFYWEHLGMLDRADYSSDWKARFEGYQAMNNGTNLVTTDDLSGIRQEKLHEVIEAIIVGELGGDGTTPFSLHHYSL